MARGIGAPNVSKRLSRMTASGVAPGAAQFGPPAALFEPPALLTLSLQIPLPLRAPVAAVDAMIPVVPVPVIRHGAVCPRQEHTPRGQDDQQPTLLHLR